MPVLTATTIREHLSSRADARVVQVGSRFEDDLSQFINPAADATAVDAALVEDRPFERIPVASAEPSGFTHFLDGAQKTWLVGYVGLNPIYVAHTSAGLLERREREVLPPAAELYSADLELVVPEGSDVERMTGLGYLPVAVEPGDLGAKVRERMANVVSARREQREIEVASRFDRGCLMIDGGIGWALESLAPSSDRMIVGIVKSHQRQYFQSEPRIRAILDLEPGERTTVFLRDRGKKQGAEAFSFYLRLRKEPNRDPLFGLIRVEIAASRPLLNHVDTIAGWILNERSPLSLPDARYDRMLYPLRLVEQHLKARQPSEAQIRGIIGL